MSVDIEYEVIEHFDDEAPEPFGRKRFPVNRQPCVGDIITLHWLDGRPAHDVYVTGIAGTTLHVQGLRERTRQLEAALEEAIRFSSEMIGSSDELSGEDMEDERQEYEDIVDNWRKLLTKKGRDRE